MQRVELFARRNYYLSYLLCAFANLLNYNVLFVCAFPRICLKSGTTVDGAAKRDGVL